MRVAVYAGTFDPITNGHLSVIESAAPLFDELIVLVAVNPDKQPMFTVEQRLELISRSVSTPGVVCAATEGYVVHFAAARGARYLVRGVRDATDARYETELARANRLLAPDIVTLFIPADTELSRVSSSALKRMAASGEDIAGYCPAVVADRLAARCAARRARNPELEDPDHDRA
jgi:pantetheine-phosphate adenylyltransferase